MKIVIAGQKEFGAAVFRIALRLGHQVVAVSCPPKNARGDGPDRLCDVATAHSVPVILGGLTSGVMPDGVGAIVAAHSHDFIGRRTRSRSQFGAFGYHPSLLPRHRGRDAVRWTLKMRDPVAGGTVYWMNETMDGGPIAVQDWCWVSPGETVESLWREKLFPIGLRLMELVLSDVEFYFGRKERQDEDVATFEPACNPPPVRRPDLLRITQHPVELMGP